MDKASPPKPPRAKQKSEVLSVLGAQNIYEIQETVEEMSVNERQADPVTGIIADMDPTELERIILKERNLFFRKRYL